MIKTCEICGSAFETLSNGHTRKYCFECSPPNCARSVVISNLRRAMKREAVKRLGGKCSKCGYNKSLAALNFHHKDPNQKEFGLSAKGITHSWESYWEEAQKCELLCANCHAELHEQEL